MDELTQEPAGAMFMCHTGGCDIMHYTRWREPRGLAGELLEDLTDMSGQLRRLPTDYAIPPGVTAAVEAAYEAALAWVELLDRR